MILVDVQSQCLLLSKVRSNTVPVKAFEMSVALLLNMVVLQSFSYHPQGNSWIKNPRYCSALYLEKTTSDYKKGTNWRFKTTSCCWFDKWLWFSVGMYLRTLVFSSSEIQGFTIRLPDFWAAFSTPRLLYFFLELPPLLPLPESAAVPLPESAAAPLPAFAFLSPAAWARAANLASLPDLLCKRWISYRRHPSGT